MHIPLQNLEIESIPVFGMYNHGRIYLLDYRDIYLGEHEGVV
jgi:hypothetical protein